MRCAHSWRVDTSLRCAVETVLSCDTKKVSSTHVTGHAHNQSGSGASVTFCGVSGLEGSDYTGADPIDLQLPRAAAGSGKPQTSPETRLIDTKSLLQVIPYHGDKASFLSWKWSFLIAVRATSKPVYEGFKKLAENMSQDFRKSR